MQTRIIGKDLRVSALGLGCMGMSEFYGARDEQLSMQVLAEAVELGIDLFDTADMYGSGHNEELIGRFLKQCSSRINIATKFGIVRQAGEYQRSIDNSQNYAAQACEASLRRLGIEQIDLYYAHRVNAQQPIEETIEGLAKLVQQGKIAHIGLCEVNAKTLRRAHAVHPISALQTEYSLWTRDVEEEILPTCRELGISFVAYSPLGRGFLTGRFKPGEKLDDDDFRATLPRFTGEALQKNQQLVDIVTQFAQQKGCSPAQLSLAWLLAKGDDIIPIPGTKRLNYLRDNVGALKVSLSPSERLELESVVARSAVVGERYTEQGMVGINA